MSFCNYHTHTKYCDGMDTPEELILEAIRLGCPEIGFSGHSHLPGETWCMTEEETLQYCSEIRRLQRQYRNSITVRLGIEEDIFSAVDRDLYDYVIGAVHFVEQNGVRWSIDESRETFLRMVNEAFSGDFFAAAESYFALVGELYERTHCDIVAHFDLVTKYNEGNVLFDTSNPRYVRAANNAMDRLAGCPVLLEVNTGAMARGYRITPYPESRLISRWLSAGKELILSSDCHDRRCLLYGFEELRDLPRREKLC